VAISFSPVKFAALNVTHNCNLRCAYCYAGDKIDRPMNLPTARQAIDFLADQTDDGCVVTFFGGEPLLAFELIREVVAYSRNKYGRRVQFRMSTNGTLIRPHILDYFRENGLYFVLSIDGNQRQHDTNRTFADRRGSYGSISNHLDDILVFNPYTIAVSVVTPATVEYVSEGVRHLFDRGFRYVLQTLDYSAPWDSAHVRELKRQYTDLAKYYFDRMAAGEKTFYSPFDERIKTHAQKPYGKGDLCDLANSQIAIAPSGRIYPCVQFIGSDEGYYLENVIGDVSSGFDPARREWFISENYRDKESCKDCALHGRCATFCGCVNWRATGSLDKVPPIVCEHERMLMPIVDRLANRLWKKNISLFKRKFYEPAFPVSSYIEDCLIRGRASHATDQTG
jgi:uncharacterized protein